MFRQATRALARTRSVLRSREPPPPSSSSFASHAPFTRFRPLVLVGFLGAAGGFVYTWGRDPRTARVAETPRVADVASEDAIAVRSPVKVLNLEAAERKLREQALSFTFRSGRGGSGRIDVLRVASNSPVEDEWALAHGKGLGGGTTLFAGVYDGHAGWATSRVLKDSLISYVSHALARLSAASDDAAVDKAIKDSFVRLDARIMGAARVAASEAGQDAAAPVLAALGPAVAGSCALLAIYDEASSTLRTAVTGDSRAVLGSWSPKTGAFTAEALSKDQTGFNDDEVRRLEVEHPGETRDVVEPKSGRLLGMAVTRAFGDHRWKWPAEVIASAQARFFGQPSRGAAYKTPPYMTARPEVTTRRVESDDFVILASDGLWDVMSNEDAVACVERWLRAKRQGRPEPEAATTMPSTLTVSADGYAFWKATPEHFAIEDLDSAAVCLVKNALGGRRRGLFCGAMTASAPLSRYVRDDMTVQVIFFQDPSSPSTGQQKT